MWCRASRAPLAVAGGLAGVEAVPDGSVPDRVHVDLEAFSVEGGDRLDELVTVEVGDARLVGLVAGGVAVGAQHGPGVVLEHPVAHDLHGRGVERADGAAIPPRGELLDLLEAAMPIPPEGADHAGGELAALGERSVRLLGGRRDPGVLPSRDAEGVQVLLREEDRALPLLLRGRRQVRIREASRRLPRAACRWVRPWRDRARSARPTGRASRA